jgi:hypothetical protein
MAGDVPPRRDWDHFIHDLLTGVRVPVVDSGVSSACQRLKVCDLIKALEKASKSKIIDSFTRNGLPLGSHRAADRIHDPLVGFVFAVKEMGFKEAQKTWWRHMASDVVTPRSLPLPGTYLLSKDSWIVQMYSKGLLNFRTGVISPAIGVCVTETEVRWRFRLSDDEENLDEILQQAHLQAAAIGAIAALLLALFAVEIAAAAAMAFAASAVWSGSAAGVYWIKRHRGEIKEKARRVADRSREVAGRAKREVRERWDAWGAPDSVDVSVESASTASVTDQGGVSTLAVGLAAAALVAALLIGPR